MFFKQRIEILLDNITWLRGHYAFSKEKMAEIMGVNVDMINEIENAQIL